MSCVLQSRDRSVPPQGLQGTHHDLDCLALPSCPCLFLLPLLALSRPWLLLHLDGGIGWVHEGEWLPGVGKGRWWLPVQARFCEICIHLTGTFLHVY